MGGVERGLAVWGPGLDGEVGSSVCAWAAAIAAAGRAPPALAPAAPRHHRSRLHQPLAPHRLRQTPPPLPHRAQFSRVVQIVAEGGELEQLRRDAWSRGRAFLDAYSPTVGSPFADVLERDYWDAAPAAWCR